ncbi:MAG: 3-dehydroquinate synthase family protein, partial [Candidatus Margulisiibacteriota bacterium]
MFNLTVQVDPPCQIQYTTDPFLTLVKVLEAHQGRKIALVLDARVHALYGERLLQTLRQAGIDPFTYCFPSGEKYKTMVQVTKLLTFLLEKQWNRDDVIVVAGGGVTGDMGAFATSICLRGVPLVALPTTLLAQVDSSIGGKTGVNHVLGKNLIGTFYQPKQVILSSLFLQTLDKREIQTGMAEVIKYAMIASPELFSLLDQEPNPQTESYWEQMIRLCVTIKTDVVERDEKESSLRKILNY